MRVADLKHAESARLQADVEKFLAKGGQVITVPPGASGIDKINRDLVFLLRETSGLQRDGVKR